MLLFSISTVVVLYQQITAFNINAISIYYILYNRLVLVHINVKYTIKHKSINIVK